MPLAASQLQQLISQHETSIIQQAQQHLHDHGIPPIFDAKGVEQGTPTQALHGPRTAHGTIVPLIEALDARTHNNAADGLAARALTDQWHLDLADHQPDPATPPDTQLAVIAELIARRAAQIRAVQRLDQFSRFTDQPIQPDADFADYRADAFNKAVNILARSERWGMPLDNLLARESIETCIDKVLDRYTGSDGRPPRAVGKPRSGPSRPGWPWDHFDKHLTEPADTSEHQPAPHHQRTWRSDHQLAAFLARGANTPKPTDRPTDDPEPEAGQTDPDPFDSALKEAISDQRAAHRVAALLHELSPEDDTPDLNREQHVAITLIEALSQALQAELSDAEPDDAAIDILLVILADLLGREPTALLPNTNADDTRELQLARTIAIASIAGIDPDDVCNWLTNDQDWGNWDTSRLVLNQLWHLGQTTHLSPSPTSVSSHQSTPRRRAVDHRQLILPELDDIPLDTDTLPRIHPKLTNCYIDLLGQQLQDQDDPGLNHYLRTVRRRGSEMQQFTKQEFPAEVARQIAVCIIDPEHHHPFRHRIEWAREKTDLLGNHFHALLFTNSSQPHQTCPCITDS